jgi:molecular chaperone HscA
MIEALELALKESAHLLLADEKQQIDAAMQSLHEATKGTNGQLIKDRIKALDDTSQPFAARRMENSIKTALTGNSVDTI